MEYSNWTIKLVGQARKAFKELPKGTGRGCIMQGHMRKHPTEDRRTSTEHTKEMI